MGALGSSIKLDNNIIPLYSIFGKKILTLQLTKKMEQGIEIIKLDIKGMTCAGCVSSVEKALVGVDGVFFAEVNF